MSIIQVAAVLVFLAGTALFPVGHVIGRRHGYWVDGVQYYLGGCALQLVGLGLLIIGWIAG